MLVSPLAVVPPLIQGGVQLVVGIYREVAPTHIIKKANGKYDEGIDVLEEYRPFMTPDQIQEIANMAQRSASLPMSMELKSLTHLFTSAT